MRVFIIFSLFEAIISFKNMWVFFFNASCFFLSFKMDGIYGVHECHIWQLAGNRIVASAHIRCHGIEEYMTLAAKIKDLFHKAGIHSTTIQPEFIDVSHGAQCPSIAPLVHFHSF